MIEERFDAPGPVVVDVRVPLGEVEITTGDGGECTVTVDGAPRLLDAMKVELVGERLLIQQRRETSLGFFDHFSESLRVQARVPGRSRVELLTAAADATLEGTFGGVEAKSSSGDIRVSGELLGDANMKTVSGDVHLPSLTGDLLAHTVSGDLTAQTVAGSVSVRSVSGDIRVGSVREGRANVQCVSGDVELGIAPGSSVDVDAGTASGELSSDIPLSRDRGDEAGPTVVVRGNTVSGDFHLFRAA